MSTEKLDRIIDGTRYRSSIRISPEPVGRGQYVGGVREVALWVCRNVVVLECDSQWDDGHGRCVGATYRVLDSRAAEGRDEIQRYADRYARYGNPEFEAVHGCDEEEMLLRLARRHAPAEMAVAS